ncbi:uncharacterized protein LOC125568294 [Nematostella vectensis]|uniref:uncharacterized protein LOC125568294 n=1 Tax=Nematostella vectensis TaxID=45351 RepID=UPI002076E807|nr:uncharacterized protein LOC125568294 [Nematostella vectensis]
MASGSTESVLQKICDTLERVERRVRVIENSVACLEELRKDVNNMKIECEKFKDGLTDLETGVGSIEEDVAEITERLETVATRETTDLLLIRVEGLENRSRRNNIIIHNVPEEAEKNSPSAVDFVQKFLRNELEIQQPIEVERAHRSPNKKHHDGSARPIFFRLLRESDKRNVLMAGATTLKGKELKKTRKSEFSSLTT